MRRQRITGIFLALFLGACGGNDSNPTAVLTDYQDARNALDVDAVMALYADDAVLRDHPLDNDGIATGVAEIRVVEAKVPGSQGPTGRIEFIDTTVSGNTVTFNHRFMNNSGDCFGGAGDQVTVEDGRITLYDWGVDDPSQCP